MCDKSHLKTAVTSVHVVRRVVVGPDHRPALAGRHDGLAELVQQLLHVCVDEIWMFHKRTVLSVNDCPHAFFRRARMIRIAINQFSTIIKMFVG